MFKYLVVLVTLSIGRLECQSPLIEEYPFVLSVSQSDEPDTICGATLVTPTCALSSAHCILSFEQDEIIVKRGSEKTIERQVERVIIPSEDHIIGKPRGLDEHDFAVLVLKKPISYDEAQTVVIDFKPIKVGDPIKIVGWSRFRDELEIDSTQVATNKTCLSMVPSTSNKFFCAPFPLKQGTAGRPALNEKGQQIAMTNYLLKSRNEGSFVYFIHFSNPESISFLNETILSNCNGAHNLPLQPQRDLNI